MNPKLNDLLQAARRARVRAYSPYSNFSVGAAVLTETGQIFEGCNIENASYGLSVCAERVAIFRAIASGSQAISAIAVSIGGSAQDRESMMPCGACLQVMGEFLRPDAEVAVDGVDSFRLRDLLPRPFSLRWQKIAVPNIAGNE